MTDALATDTKYKAVDYIETYTGRAFHPLRPAIEEVSIIDIAHALANQCRYSGHTEWFYSTAQHCCLLADYVETVAKGTPLDCLQILLHDAAEAYLLDIPRPIKQFMPEYRKWDFAVQMCVRSWAGLNDIPIPPWQDELDSRIIHDERAQVMSDSGNDWQHAGEPLGIYIAPWTHNEAEQNFLLRYALYTYQIFGAHQYLRSAWGIPTHAMYLPPFQTVGGDVLQRGTMVDPKILTDVNEVDLRGGVGRVALRSPDGMMVRDTRAGTFPRAAWKWLHGHFQLSTPNVDSVAIELRKPA